MNAANNGPKLFLYIVRHRISKKTVYYLVRSDHDPSVPELTEALGIGYDPEHDDLSAIRYAEENVALIPPLTSKEG